MGVVVAFELPAVEVRDRLVGWLRGWRRAAVRRQRENAFLYVRAGQHGGRKSLQPTLFGSRNRRLGTSRCSSFSPTRPGSGALDQGVRGAGGAALGVLAWIVDDTGIVKDGKHSPGVKRQHSGTFGKIDNCQITVCVHAVGERGTLPFGWRLYLPEEWCDDCPPGKAKIRRGRS